MVIMIIWDWLFITVSPFLAILITTWHWMLTKFSKLFTFPLRSGYLWSITVFGINSVVRHLVFPWEWLFYSGCANLEAVTYGEWWLSTKLSGRAILLVKCVNGTCLLNILQFTKNFSHFSRKRSDLISRKFRLSVHFWRKQSNICGDVTAQKYFSKPFAAVW